MKILLGAAAMITCSMAAVVLVFRLTGLLIASVGSYLARVLAVAVAIVVIVLLVSKGVWRFRWLASFRRQRPYPPRSYTESAWKDLLKSADPVSQEEIILLTNHQSVGLTPRQFLGVLEEVQSVIKQEPALSTYWAHRAELEQRLKQERQG